MTGYIILVLLVLVFLIITAMIMRSTTKLKIGGGAKYYYHGSPTRITKLDPRPSSVIDNEKAVFATSSREMALIFISKFTDLDFEMGIYKNRIYILENIPGAIKEKLNCPGYLHYVDSRKFHSDPRLGLQNIEFISDTSVPVVKVQKINNVYKELVKSGKVAFITHSQKLNALESTISEVKTM